MKKEKALSEKMPTIEDYGIISDCHSVALVSTQASIDWCCMPKIDSPSCFGRIINVISGGYCQIFPRQEVKVNRRYLKNTLILEFYFESGSSKAKLTDCFVYDKKIDYPVSQVLRIIEGIEGEMDFKLDILPRFDYGLTKPWIRKYNKNLFVAIASDQGLCVSSNIDFNFKKRHQVQTFFKIKKNQKKYLSLQWGIPHELEQGNFYVYQPFELDFLLKRTINCWKSWSSQCSYKGIYSGLVLRSALTLKALSNSATGGIAAAATTSLPEALPGNRNWDYRYCWIRDSYFTINTLSKIGFRDEARMFDRFIDRSSGDTASGLQVLYGIDGRKFIYEYTLEKLSGYKGAKPVRIGNLAFEQHQLGNDGWLLEMFYRSEKLNFPSCEERWSYISGIVKIVINNWELSDSGIWERRDREENFVFSKVLCWSTINRAIILAKKLNKKIHKSWLITRKLIYEAIMEKGYDKKRGVFIQSFECKNMDSALLLMPRLDFIKYENPKMIRTAQAIWEDLRDEGLIRRYPADIDSLEGNEGVFLPSCFWLVTCFAKQGFHKEARKIFKRAITTGNDLGLFAEIYDTSTKKPLGNFPQAYTHLSLIDAVLSLKKT